MLYCSKGNSFGQKAPDTHHNDIAEQKHVAYLGLNVPWAFLPLAKKSNFTKLLSVIWACVSTLDTGGMSIYGAGGAVPYANLGPCPLVFNLWNNGIHRHDKQVYWHSAVYEHVVNQMGPFLLNILQNTKPQIARFLHWWVNMWANSWSQKYLGRLCIGHAVFSMISLSASCTAAICFWMGECVVTHLEQWID